MASVEHLNVVRARYDRKVVGGVKRDASRSGGIAIRIPRRLDRVSLGVHYESAPLIIEVREEEPTRLIDGASFGRAVGLDRRLQREC